MDDRNRPKLNMPYFAPWNNPFSGPWNLTPKKSVSLVCNQKRQNYCWRRTSSNRSTKPSEFISRQGSIRNWSSRLSEILLAFEESWQPHNTFLEQTEVFHNTFIWRMSTTCSCWGLKILDFFFSSKPSIFDHLSNCTLFARKYIVFFFSQNNAQFGNKIVLR